MAYIKNPTEKQKNEWAEKAKQNEKEAFEMIRKVAEDYKQNPEHLAEYFTFASNFYKYSPNNVSLIYSQNQHATFVQSFKAWNDMGASIIKGTKGIKVLVPKPVTYLKTGEKEYTQLSKATQAQKELYEQGNIESYQKMSYGVGNVFDISQTNYPKEEYPKIFNMGYSSEKHHAITEGLIKFSENEIKCPVEYENVESISLRGYYVPSQHRIVLNQLMEDTVQLSTMSHELGHALAHHEVGGRSLSQIEFEGDAISIMVQHNFGVGLTEQRKSHLADHFKKFHGECRNKVMDENTENIPEKAEEKINGLLQESFSSVFDIYKNNIDVIEQYVNRELELQDDLYVKVGNVFKKNGIDADTFNNWVKNGKLEIENDKFCRFQDENVSLDISLNQFLKKTSQVAYYSVDQEADTLFITQNSMEFMKKLSHDTSVLLVENGANIETEIQLVDNKNYKYLEFGNMIQGEKIKLQNKLNLPEYHPKQLMEKDIQMEI